MLDDASKRWKIIDVFLVGSAFGTLTLGFWLYARFGFSPLAGITNGSMEPHMDFDVFLHSARALWEGGDVYSENGGPSISTNPPFWTVLVAPLALLEPITAYRLFVLITVSAGVASMAWMAAELGLRPVWAVIAATMLLFSNPFLGTLALGQVYPLLTLGLVVAWVADRRGKPLTSGAALGVVLAVKPQFAPVLLWPLVQRKCPTFAALGVVLAVKPQFAPVLLWPLVRRRWGTFAAALTSGAAATLVGVIVAGPRALIDWVAYVSSRQPDGYWDNNTLPAAAARLFRDNHFVEPIATLPWVEPVSYVLAVGIIILTALRVRHDPEMGLWVLVAASLLAPSVSWHNYLVLLGPGLLLLLARGWTSLALLLLALQFIPPVWSEPWRHGSTVVAALMLTFYLYILLMHWLVFFLSTRKEPYATKKAEVL